MNAVFIAPILAPIITLVLLRAARRRASDAEVSAALDEKDAAGVPFWMPSGRSLGLRRFAGSAVAALFAVVLFVNAASATYNVAQATLGTVTSGVWNGTAIGATYGGTGQTSCTTGDILYASASNTWSKLASSTSGYVLTAGGAGVAPSWAAVTATNPTGQYGPYTKTLSNSSGSAQAFVTIAPANNTGVGVSCHYTIVLADASAHYAVTGGEVIVDCTNIGGTYTQPGASNHAEWGRHDPTSTFTTPTPNPSADISSGLRLKVTPTFGGSPTTVKITYYLFITAETQPTVTPG